MSAGTKTPKTAKSPIVRGVRRNARSIVSRAAPLASMKALGLSPVGSAPAIARDSRRDDARGCASARAGRGRDDGTTAPADASAPARRRRDDARGRRRRRDARGPARGRDATTRGGEDSASGFGTGTFASPNGVDAPGDGDAGAENKSLSSLGVSPGDLVRRAVKARGEGDGGARGTATTRRDETRARERERERERDEGDASAMESDATRTRDEDAGAMPRTMREALGEWRGELEAAEAAFLAIHALMLDSGAKTAGEIELRDGLARRGCYSARYAVGARGREDTVTCSVRAQPVESRLSVFGTLESDAGSAGVAYATLIQASDYVDEGGSITPEGCRALWAKVKEAMTTKLFEAAKAQLAGILSPGTLMSLPTDVKRRIAENLDAYGLAYCACTCKELRAVCSDDELWTRLLQTDFDVPPMPTGISSRSLYNKHAMRRSAEREERLRMESYHPMPGRLPRHGFVPDPDRDIYAGIPGHVPGIIGGDYDLWPGGLNPNPPPRPIPGYGRGGLGGPGRPRGGWPGGGPPFPPQPGGLPYNPDPDADLRNPPDIPGRGRGGFPSMPPNPGWDGRPRPPPDFF